MVEIEMRTSPISDLPKLRQRRVQSRWAAVSQYVSEELTPDSFVEISGLGEEDARRCRQAVLTYVRRRKSFKDKRLRTNVKEKADKPGMYHIFFYFAEGAK